MHPELLKIGPVIIHTYGALIALGIFISVLLATRLAKKTGFPPRDKVFDLFFVAVASGFAGARIFYVFQEWGYYEIHPLEIFKIWEGGLVYYGGVIGSSIGYFFYTRRQGFPYLKSIDFTIPFIALTHAFGRIGCFFAGCCFGKNGQPVQLYEATFNFLLAGILIRIYQRSKFGGQVFAIYLILYPIGRFLLEFLRADQSVWIFTFTSQQLVSIIFILAGLGLYGIRRPRS